MRGALNENVEEIHRFYHASEQYGCGSFDLRTGKWSKLVLQVPMVPLILLSDFCGYSRCRGHGDF